MNKWTIYLIYFFSSFCVMFLAYLLFINRYRKDYNEGKLQLSINYIIKKYNLDMRKTKYKTVKLAVSLINSFIIAFTFTVIINIKQYIWKMLVGFVILMILIYSIYDIVGKAFKKKENRGKQN